ITGVLNVNEDFTSYIQYIVEYFTTTMDKEVAEVQKKIQAAEMKVEVTANKARLAVERVAKKAQDAKPWFAFSPKSVKISLRSRLFRYPRTRTIETYIFRNLSIVGL